MEKQNSFNRNQILSCCERERERERERTCGARLIQQFALAQDRSAAGKQHETIPIRFNNLPIMVM
ncbi:hypothetical protein TSUD_342050 [Trifolium subterraneum]|nr:hypothetical protein TSUD_342050 [Trifolium subterraneum]